MLSADGEPPPILDTGDCFIWLSAPAFGLARLALARRMPANQELHARRKLMRKRGSAITLKSFMNYKSCWLRDRSAHQGRTILDRE